MAISYSQAATAGYTTTPTLALPGSATAGDLLIGIGRYLNTGGNAPAGGAGLSDNLNGAYTPFHIVSDTSTQWYMYLAWVKATVTGTPTMTVANFSGGGFLSIVNYTGFVVGANIATPDTITAQATASTTLSTGTVVNTKNAELMFGWYNASAGILQVEPPPGWTNRSTPSAVRAYDQIGVSSGSNVSMSGTFAASQNWNAGIQGFFDGLGAPAISSLNTANLGPGISPFNNNTFMPALRSSTGPLGNTGGGGGGGTLPSIVIPYFATLGLR